MHSFAQALLDVYTIQREIGRLDNFHIGLIGDLANGRTVRSLAYVLSMYKNVKMFFVAPDVVGVACLLACRPVGLLVGLSVGCQGCLGCGCVWVVGWRVCWSCAIL